MNTQMKEKMLLCVACVFLLASYGCSFATVNLSKAPASDAKPPQTPTEKAPEKVQPIFLYQYDNDGKPVRGGRILEVLPDGKVLVETFDPETGKTFQWELDPRGWLVVAPVSPIKKIETPAK